MSKLGLVPLSLLKNKAVILLSTFFLSSIIVAIYFENTYDNGDSISHYLISHYAFKHPILFLNHWGKPLFTLLSSPFAQFGFAGIKVFNCIVALLSSILAYRVAKWQGIANSSLAIVFIYFAPNYFLCQFSGLTEPLFGLFLIAAYYFYITDKKILSIVIISFLPFIRTEGWIIGLVYLVFLLFKKQWKLLPFLLLGNLVYALIGTFVYGDFLWAFTQNPYAGVEEKYGSGTLFHFIDQYPYVIGIPLFGLLIAGCLQFFINIISKSKRYQHKFFTEEFFMIYACFFAFLIAHSVFWKFGLFRSYGLKRVLVALIPINSIVCLYGFNLIVNNTEKLNKWASEIFRTLIIILVLVFPFIGNKASLHIPADFRYDKIQITARAASNWIKQQGLQHRKIYYHTPTLALELGIDPFDNIICDNINKVNVEQLPKGSLIVWDAWYALTEADVSKEVLDNSFNYSKKHSINSIDFPEFKSQENFEVVIYEVLR